MVNTGAIFVEQPVPDTSGNKVTDDVCRKIDAQHYDIDGKEITFPVKVRAASMLLNTFIVPTAEVTRIIAGSGFRPLEIWPGKAVLQLLAVDYRENDLGDYNEGAIIFPVLTPGQKVFPVIGAIIGMAMGKIGNYVYRMPVNQAFTTHAGRFIWGFPKWVSQMEISFGDKEATGRFTDEDKLVYQINAATGGIFCFSGQKTPSLAIRNNRAWKTYGINSADGVTFSFSGKTPDIGTEHPLANELRALGLPKKPLCTISAKEVRMDFNGPEDVAIGAAFTT